MTFKTLGTNFHFIVISTTIRGDAKRKLENLWKKGIKEEKKEEYQWEGVSKWMWKEKKENEKMKSFDFNL